MGRDWHVLDFYSDDHGNSALTAVARGVWFHVIADASKLSPDSQMGTEYRQLLAGSTGDNAQNTSGQPLQEEHHVGQETDSGVDMTEESTTNTSKSSLTEDDKQSMSAEAQLQSWMFGPLATNLDDLTSDIDLTMNDTLQNWYDRPTRFCELRISADRRELEAVELTSTPELEKRIENLRPKVTLPKYLTKHINVPIYKASNLLVLEASAQPVGTPYHPCRVRCASSKNAYFLKIVDNTQPATTKRELEILNRVLTLQLHQQIHVPVLAGLVVFDCAGTTAVGQMKIMGFLQTHISDPAPLTNMFDSSISQTKRERWAKKAEEMKEMLHKHNIIWGDAKADNFMVDKKGELWIIDFGGSYTEGWVDPELMETKEGDDVGTTKVVNALRDPIANTCSFEDEEADETPAKEEREKRPRKRRMTDDEENCIDKADVAAASHLNYKRKRLAAY